MLTDLRCVSPRKVWVWVWWGYTVPSAGKAVVVLQTELQEQKPTLAFAQSAEHTHHTCVPTLRGAEAAC